MLRKILKSFISNKHSHSYRKYSSSDFKRSSYKHRHPSKYGHHYYKKRHGSSSFFSSYSS
ncbi:hypothetical protein OIH86_22760 [Metabacillus halosaccharovorans]|uniref:Uncharacterized protein n=1 Tax=Metabacillus halosaccharovorans TaxID=930124 RepID=A0ABT3DPE2_9BACI|nr:hypothetical protein [Metabacillus halosaccharovorans]MCV9888477.1 hypothetical protein [Metabacillus halosaccharovorans]